MSEPQFKITLAQLNPTVGDVAGNAAKARAAREKALADGADLVVPNGSPYARDKNDLRLSIAVARVTESGLPLIYLNQIGGQDELVFDGASFALNADLSVAAQLPAFQENITTLTWTKGDAGWRCSGHVVPLPEGDKGDYAACVLGLR